MRCMSPPEPTDLAGVERYLRRALRSGQVSLTALRDHYGLRPPRGLLALPQLDIPEHTLSSYDELLGGAPSGVPWSGVTRGDQPRRSRG